MGFVLGYDVLGLFVSGFFVSFEKGLGFVEVISECFDGCLFGVEPHFEALNASFGLFEVEFKFFDAFFEVFCASEHVFLL